MNKLFAEFRACWNLVIEYRLQVLIWILTIVLPLIMLAGWLSIAENGPVGSYDKTAFIAYYLAALIVRNMTGAWFIWEMDSEMRLGALSFRLLKPMDPMVHFVAAALASKPLRLILLAPIAIAAVVWIPDLNWASDPLTLGLFAGSLVGAWAILFLMQYTIGLTGFWITRTIGVNDAWFFAYSLASGYLVPLDLYPPIVREILLYLPFRYTMSFPIDILTQKLTPSATLAGIALQWFWVVVTYGVCRWVWKRGLVRYSAVGA
jgi:ABC-2 type transport system permease protein